MKKLLTAVSLFALSFATSQNLKLIVNNYSTKFDFHGSLSAHGFGGTCYPYVTTNSPAMVIVPAEANMNNGNELIYNNFKDQYTNSLYPNASWVVQLSATNQQIRAWNHASIMPGGTISANTKWSSSQYQMYYKGTSIPSSSFSGLIGEPQDPCTGASSYISSPYGHVEWFNITTENIDYSYLQIY